MDSLIKIVCFIKNKKFKEIQKRNSLVDRPGDLSFVVAVGPAATENVDIAVKMRLKRKEKKIKFRERVRTSKNITSKVQKLIKNLKRIRTSKV